MIATALSRSPASRERLETTLARAKRESRGTKAQRGTPRPGSRAHHRPPAPPPLPTVARKPTPHTGAGISCQTLAGILLFCAWNPALISSLLTEPTARPPESTTPTREAAQRSSGGSRAQGTRLQRNLRISLFGIRGSRLTFSSPSTTAGTQYSSRSRRLKHQPLVTRPPSLWSHDRLFTLTTVRPGVGRLDRDRPVGGAMARLGPDHTRGLRGPIGTEVPFADRPTAAVTINEAYYRITTPRKVTSPRCLVGR